MIRVGRCLGVPVLLDTEDKAKAEQIREWFKDLGTSGLLFFEDEIQFAERTAHEPDETLPPYLEDSDPGDETLNPEPDPE